jgi:hypothetical protein
MAMEMEQIIHDGWTRVSVVGANGLRLIHVWINLETLAWLRQLESKWQRVSAFPNLNTKGYHGTPLSPFENVSCGGYRFNSVSDSFSRPST